MNAPTHPLVEDYLIRLETAASALPPDRRSELVSEIRGHFEEGIRGSEGQGDTYVRNLVERLGSPQEIVDAASDPSPSINATPAPTNSSAVLSVLVGALWILGIGSILALVFGYRARRQIAASNGTQQGSTLATVGIVLGWVGIVLLLLVVAGGVGLVAGSGGGSTPATPR